MPDNKPTEYPASFFPQVSKAKAERTRKQLFTELEQLPTGVVAQALEAAKAAINAEYGPVTKDPGSHEGDRTVSEAGGQSA